MAFGTFSGRASGPVSGALLSCLGFPGWGGQHLIVPSQADPPGLAWRLQLCHGDGDSPLAAGLLLPELLRRHLDLEPLHPGCWPWAGGGPETWPDAWPETLGHRYLLVCRWGAAQPLRISAWHREDARRWIQTCRPMPLKAFRQRFLEAPDRASPLRDSYGRFRR